MALPCATQNELNLDDAKALVANGCIAVAEGANMPTTLEATQYLQKNGVLFAPGKASNAGGVATSALEMSQNSERLSWTFEEVDQKLQQIMTDIFAGAEEAADRYDVRRLSGSRRQHRGLRKVANAACWPRALTFVFIFYDITPHPYLTSRGKEPPEPASFFLLADRPSVRPFFVSEMTSAFFQCSKLTAVVSAFSSNQRPCG